MIVRARISVETFNKLQAVIRVPRRRWGQYRVPDYWGGFIERFITTVEFHQMERESQVERLKAEVGSKEFLLKLKGAELEKKNQEIETLKKQLSENGSDKKKSDDE